METIDNRTTMSVITNTAPSYESGSELHTYNHDREEVNLRHHLNEPGMGNQNQTSYKTKRNSSRHYYQGGYEYDFVDEHEWRRHECPICLSCLRDPHQTSCGHRFCYTCILTWLNEGKTCPHDNCTIGEGDIFPDTFANREILQLLVRCPYSKEFGCTSVIPLVDIEAHAQACPRALAARQQESQSSCNGKTNATESFTCPSCGELTDLPDIKGSSGSRRHNLICPNVEVACPLAAAGCSEKIVRAELGEHTQNSTVKHVQLLWERLLKLQQMQSAQDNEVCRDETPECSGSASNAETSSLHGESSGIAAIEASPSSIMSRDTLRMSGSNIHSTQRLLKDLFHRVVALEQKNRQMEIINVNVRNQIKELQMLNDNKEEERWEMLGKSCNGKFVWKIKRFSEQYQKMLANNQYVIYSHPFYTSPFGYKLCLRGNMKLIDSDKYLGLFIHLMKGENDDILDWPFEGEIHLTVKNRDSSRLHREDLKDIIVTTNSEAFQRPTLHRNEVGIGHPDFIRISALYSGGFIAPGYFEKESCNPTDDILVIKANVVCIGNDE